MLDHLPRLSRRAFAGVLLAAISTVAASVDSDASARTPTDNRNVRMHLGIEDSLQSLLHHPAFAGHARLLMPYHDHVEPHVVVAALNRMIDDVDRGQAVFRRFYSDAQRHADPTKNNTGLFFFRGKVGAPFALIAPGGGFAYVGSLHEGFPYAQEISRLGRNALVLRYRPGLGEQAATEDMAAALSWVFEHSAELGIDTRGYSVWGSSAGARMAANIGSLGPAAFGGDALPKPAAVVMAYTGHSRVAPDEPPTFVVVGAQDGIARPATMEQRVASLRAQGTRVEYRRYEGLGHGFGLGSGTRAEGWVAEAVQFWSKVRSPARP
jgi:acetyl esterase/lipase